MSRWSVFWYFTGNFWSKRRKSRWRSVRRPYWISDKKISGFRILVQRPSNTPKIIKIGQPCLWTNLQILHGFLVDTLLNRNMKVMTLLGHEKLFCNVLHIHIRVPSDKLKGRKRNFWLFALQPCPWQYDLGSRSQWPPLGHWQLLCEVSY